MTIIPVIAGVLILAIIAVIFMTILNRPRKGGLSLGRKGSGDRAAILKSANKRLAQNPKDPEALYALSDIYFQEESWDKVMKTCETLTETLSSSTLPGIDSFEVFRRYAISALKLNLTDQAYKALNVARTFKQDNFDVNYNLGHLEFTRKNYEKAVQLLQQARTQDPESPMVLRDLGHALFRLKKPKDAMNFIRKAIDLAPEDKESLFTLAECYYEANQTDQALRIFSHLRSDPVMGPSACLFAGSIHNETRQAAAAIQDFEIGLRHQNIKPDVLVDLRYKLAITYIKENAIDKALPLLRTLQAENDSYKDVNVLLGKYQELNANKNLQIFLMAPSADFIALCRKITMTYYARAKVKISNIAVNKNEWADITAEIDTPKWSDVVMFRFIRTQGTVGELVVRDFHSHLKEVKAGKGICITVGNFGEEAKRYTEARLIDLIEKDRLSAILNTVDAKASAMQAARKK
jgi:lipopolysaccharide biosynthesis regulator YciM